MPNVSTQTQEPEELPIAFPVKTQGSVYASLVINTDGIWTGDRQNTKTKYWLTTTGEEGNDLDAALLDRCRKVAEKENAHGIIKHEDNAMFNSFNSIWITKRDKYGNGRYVGTLHATYVPKCVMLQWLEELGWRVEREVAFHAFVTELTIKKV